MDVNLDEDFVNFESVAQTCGSSMSFVGGVDEELILLDSEVTRRENQFQDSKREKNNNDDRLNACNQVSNENVEEEGRYFVQRDGDKKEANSSSTSGPSRDRLFASFSFNGAAKRLTMMPGKCKLKDERRKVLKISVNKLKKIEDPESWLCRSVLINNTMRKLQKETRDEKINKHLNDVSTLPSGLLSKYSESDHFDFRLNRDSDIADCRSDNKENGRSVDERTRLIDTDILVDSENGSTSDVTGNGGRHCDTRPVGEDVVEALPPIDEIIENEFLSEGENTLKNSEETNKSRFGLLKDRSIEVKMELATSKDNDKVHVSGSLVEKIAPTKRCASRKISVDEEGSVVQAFSRSSHECRENLNTYEANECDVHDVLGQLYMPPTPKMVTSIDSDTDEDELNVVDLVDSSRVESSKSENKSLLEKYDYFEEVAVGGIDDLRKRSREKDLQTTENIAKRRKSDEDEELSHPCEMKNVAEEERDEVISKKICRSLSVHYQHKSSGDGFFDENCDSQYSCGHAVTMFGSDLQTVVFHNLIPGLET